MLRSNLVVLASAHVTSIALMKDAGGIIIATGVKFVHHEKAYQTFVAKEVVLSAGCVRKSRTPRNTDTDSSPQGHHVSSGTFNKTNLFRVYKTLSRFSSYPGLATKIFFKEPV